jgi:hypothetical protein
MFQNHGDAHGDLVKVGHCDQGEATAKRVVGVRQRHTPLVRPPLASPPQGVVAGLADQLVASGVGDHGRAHYFPVD